MWHVISSAPFDRDLELALVDANGVHAIFFPCRRVVGGWIKAEMKTPINVRPTHWRDWAKANAMIRGRPYPLQRGHRTSRSATHTEASGSRSFSQPKMTCASRQKSD